MGAGLICTRAERTGRRPEKPAAPLVDAIGCAAVCRVISAVLMDSFGAGARSQHKIQPKRDVNGIGNCEPYGLHVRAAAIACQMNAYRPSSTTFAEV